MISIHQLAFGYTKQRTLFANLNLDLQPGKIYGLLGRNGAGKSTLLKHLTGMLFARSGNVNVFGFDPTKREPAFLQETYFIPEEFQLPDISIQQYSHLTAVFYPQFNYDELTTYLKEFELDPAAKLSKLSYGQKKKFLIAFGLATNARLLILDEPTNGLDIPSKSQFRKLMANSLNEKRIIVISTHQVRDLENLIDNVIILEKGAIIYNQSVNEGEQRVDLEQLFIHHVSTI